MGVGSQHRSSMGTRLIETDQKLAEGWDREEQTELVEYPPHQPVGERRAIPTSEVPLARVQQQCGSGDGGEGNHYRSANLSSAEMVSGQGVGPGGRGRLRASARVGSTK